MRYIEIIWEYLKTGCAYLGGCVGYAAALYAVIFAIRFVIGKSQKGKVRFRQYLAEFGLVLWVCLILKVTGMLDLVYWEIPKAMEILDTVCRIPFAGNAFSMIVLNLLLFMPFGFLLPVVFPGFVKSGKKVFLAGLMFSVGIELTQLFSGRMFESDDIIANSLGALLGYLIFLITRDIYRLLSKKNSTQGGVKAEEETRRILRRILRRIMLTILTYGIGLFMISLAADGEKIQWQEEIEYPGIDGDQTAIEDICKMRMISEKGIYEEDGIRSSDFDVAFRWMATEIDSHMSFYHVEDDILNTPDLSDEVNLRSDYIEIWYSSPHSFYFINKKDFIMQDVQYFLYDATNGEIRYGETYDRINGHLEYTDMQYPFSPNEDLIYIIEHGSVN